MSTIRLTHNLGMTPKKTLIPSCLFREELNVFYPVDSSFGFCKKTFLSMRCFISLSSRLLLLFFISFVLSFSTSKRNKRTNTTWIQHLFLTHSLSLSLSLTLAKWSSRHGVRRRQHTDTRFHTRQAHTRSLSNAHTHRIATTHFLSSFLSLSRIR